MQADEARDREPPPGAASKRGRGGAPPPPPPPPGRYEPILTSLMGLRQIPEREWSVVSGDSRVRRNAGLVAACRAATGSIVLSAALRPTLEAHGTRRALEELEMPLVPVLVRGRAKGWGRGGKGYREKIPRRGYLGEDT